MRSHLGLMMIFAALVAAVFAALLRDDIRDQLRLGGIILAGLAASAIVLGWLMYPIPL